MKKLFLDDKRMPEDCTSYMRYNKKEYLEGDWYIVRNFKEFKKYIEACGKHGLPYLISFDHDLADEHYTPESLWDDYPFSKLYQENRFDKYKEKTGNDCAKWLIEYLQEQDVPLEDYPKWIVHSMNPVGADYIASTLLQGEKYKRNLENKKHKADELFDLFEKTEPFIKQQPFIPPSYPGKLGHPTGIEFPSYGVAEHSKMVAEDIVKERQKRTQEIIDNGYKIPETFNTSKFKKPKIAKIIPKQEKEDFIEEIPINKTSKKDLLVAGLVVFGALLTSVLVAIFT